MTHHQDSPHSYDSAHPNCASLFIFSSKHQRAYLSTFLFCFVSFSHCQKKTSSSWMFELRRQLWRHLKQSSLDRQQQVETRRATRPVKHITLMTSTASRCRGTLRRRNAWRSLVSTVSKQKPLWGETDPWFGSTSRSWWFKPGGEWMSNQIWGKRSEGKETERGLGEKIYVGGDRQYGNMAGVQWGADKWKQMGGKEK